MSWGENTQNMILYGNISPLSHNTLSLFLIGSQLFDNAKCISSICPICFSNFNFNKTSSSESALIFKIIFYDPISNKINKIQRSILKHRVTYWTFPKRRNVDIPREDWNCSYRHAPPCLIYCETVFPFFNILPFSCRSCYSLNTFVLWDFCSVFYQPSLGS